MLRSPPNDALLYIIRYLHDRKQQNLVSNWLPSDRPDLQLATSARCTIDDNEGAMKATVLYWTVGMLQL